MRKRSQVTINLKKTIIGKIKPITIGVLREKKRQKNKKSKRGIPPEIERRDKKEKPQWCVKLNELRHRGKEGTGY